MFTIHHGLSGHAAHVGWQPTRAMRIAALLGALIVMSIAVNALTTFADSRFLQRSSAPGDCSAITETADRLACYDSLAHRPAPNPQRAPTRLRCFIPSDEQTPCNA